MRKPSLTLDETKKILDSVSPSYCGAKWSQVLFQFHLGKLHNCCLTPAQPIDKTNLFNSDQLITERQLMLKGEKISGCETCWKAEENGLVSDRVYKSSEPSNFALYESSKINKTTDVNSTYIELSLSNRCQFKCAYCSPENSSSIFLEIKSFGPYRLTNEYNIVDYLERSANYFLETDENPYVDAFIDWFPKIASTVEVFRFTGGEPLLSNRLFDVVNLLKQHPSPNLELIFNSNLGVSESVMDKFIQQLSAMPTEIYGQLTFVTSLDGWGEGARLVRWGLDLDVFERNFNKIRETFPKAKIRITATLNLLAFSDYKNLLKKIYEWKMSQSYSDQILITTYPLHYPSFLSLKWSIPYFKDQVEEIMAFINQHYIEDGDGIGFKRVEKDMLEKALLVGPYPSTDDTALFDLTLFMFQYQNRKGWSDSFLSEPVKKILAKGLKLLEEKINRDDVDPIFALNCLPWIPSSQERIQNLLAIKVFDGSLNVWKILDIHLSYVQYLDDSWIEWWYKLEKAQIGNRIYSLKKTTAKIDMNALIRKYAVNARPAFWIYLIENTDVFALIDLETLLLLPEPTCGEQEAFWNKVRSCTRDWRIIELQKLQRLLTSKLASSKFFSWMILEVFVQFRENPDPSWVEFWFFNQFPEIGTLMLREGLDQVVNIKLLLFKVSMKKSPKLWSLLTGNDYLLSKLDEGILKKMFVMSPQPMETEQHIFWMEVQKKNPGLQLILPTTNRGQSGR